MSVKYIFWIADMTLASKAMSIILGKCLVGLKC